MNVEFLDGHHAEIVKSAVSVEPELRPQVVARVLEVEGATLRACFRACDPRSLRVSASSFLELVQVAVETIEALSIERK